MKMDKKRQGEIALLCLRHEVAKKGIRLDQNKLRDLGNAAKKIDVPFEELKEFYRILAQEALDNLFPAEKVA